MNQKIILNNNIEIPALGFGTWQLTGNTCIKATQFALETGYRHIDTAEIYRNEEEVGIAIKNSKIQREEIFITSKVWQDELNYTRLIKSFELSLRKLKRLIIRIVLWTHHH